VDFADRLEYTLLKGQILPRVLQLASQPNSTMSARVNALMCLAKTCTIYDNLAVRAIDHTCPLHRLEMHSTIRRLQLPARMSNPIHRCFVIP
jgi:hypothetical protein